MGEDKGGIGKLLKRIGRVQAYRLLLALAFLLLWQAVSSLSFVSDLLVASPIDVIQALINALSSAYPKIPDFYLHVQRTSYEILAAYALTVGIGLPLGIAFWASKHMADAYEPFLLAYLAFPTVVLFPTVFMIFGIGATSKIMIGFLVGFVYIVFNVAAGLRQADPELIYMSRSLGHGYLDTIFKVAIPSTLPAIISGLRIGFNHTFIGVMVGELVNANTGMGYLVNWTALSFFTPELYAVIIATVTIGAVGDSAFRIAEHRLLRWTRI